MWVKDYTRETYLKVQSAAKSSNKASNREIKLTINSLKVDLILEVPMKIKA